MKTIGKYQVTDEIGRTAAGVTCRARDPFRSRDYALKILSPLAALAAAAKDQLYRDLAISWDLSHRHIAKVHDVGELDGGVYIATELLAGTSLANFLSSQMLSVAEKLGLLAQVCEGLACAHAQGLVHGNLKPGNIFVSDARNAAILDFGTGTWQYLLMSSGVRLNNLLPDYLAPEQILGERFDERSDVFSVGVILYEALRGQHPFQAPAGLIPREIVHAEPDSLRKWDTLIPSELDEIVLRALKKNPKERVQTADELAANLYVLAQHLRREPPAPRRDIPIVETVSETAASVDPVAPAAVQSEPAAPVDSVPPSAAPVEEPLPAATAFASPVTALPQVETIAAREVPASPPLLIAAPPVVSAAPIVVAAPVSAPSPAAEVRPGRVAAAPAPRQPQPAPAKPRKQGRRLFTFATGAVMALSMVAVIVVRQNQGAPADNHHGAAQAATTPSKNDAPVTPEAPRPAPVEAAPVHAAPEPAVPVAPAQPAPEQILRGEVKTLWEAGQYAQAMRLVDDVLTESPANAEARAWKKKIRAAQEAEAAMK